MAIDLTTNEKITQRELTPAIERFARKHDKGVFGPNQKKYEELIPKQSPNQSQQYAFEVDLDKCTGCKACVTACHNENGLEEGETWRSVGLLQGGSSTNPALQHVTTACHHCAEPACMSGCPTKAYDKDDVTGIVKHLDDQCFGCQYCILKCPYDVPKYSKKKGIVHKCDMCVSRLTDGQAPACVRACPTGAIRITLVDKVDVRTNPSDFVNVPDSPASDYTFPTTKYIRKKPLPTNMVSADYYSIEPEHSHLPLVFMLVLTQLSVGAFLIEFLLRNVLGAAFYSSLFSFYVVVALGIGLVALGSSILHLGRPQYAYRAILGLKTSWLSREILAFGVFAKLAILYAVCSWFMPAREFLMKFLGHNSFNVIAFTVLTFGLLGVICSVRVYRDTKRPFWDNHLTTFKFLLSMVLLGCVMMFLSTALFSLLKQEVFSFEIIQFLTEMFAMIAVIFSMLKLGVEMTIFFYLPRVELNHFKKTAILMTRQLKNVTIWRFICGVIGGVLIPVILLQLNQGVGSIGMFAFAFTIFGLVLVGELLERYLFFRAVVPLKMPGI